MSFLDGDGREVIKADKTFAMPGVQPMQMRRATARMLFEKLISTGDSMHSPAGNTLWVLIQACHEKKIRYELSVWPGEAFYIRLIK